MASMKRNVVFLLVVLCMAILAQLNALSSPSPTSYPKVDGPINSPKASIDLYQRVSMRLNNLLFLSKQSYMVVRCRSKDTDLGIHNKLKTLKNAGRNSHRARHFRTIDASLLPFRWSPPIPCLLEFQIENSTASERREVPAKAIVPAAEVFLLSTCAAGLVGHRMPTSSPFPDFTVTLGMYRYVSELWRKQSNAMCVLQRVGSRGYHQLPSNIGIIPPTHSDMVAALPDNSKQIMNVWNPYHAWRHCRQVGSSFLGSRMLSTIILSPNSSDLGFRSDSLKSKKHVTNSEHTQGLYQDLVMPVTNFHFEDKGLMTLAGDVFDVPIRKDIVHRVVRWQLAKRQQGTHSTKTISEVSGTGKKPYPQKGTGRARHGTLRGPQFRGGATMHGPKPRSHAIKLNKKVRRLGLKIALSARRSRGKLLVFEDLEVPTHKTKNIVNWFNQMEGSKKLLLVDGGPITEKLKLATQNLYYVNVLPSIGLNVYSILQHDTLVMSRDAVQLIVDRMHTPINRCAPLNLAHDLVFVSSGHVLYF
ncbi:hypothetical protein Nepgr_021913 [Nepenthes gracilis]|uniref:Large ribosomal subunit protein uL4m n=1 Tax=Nepenthes gracilis TaxID=150966 RepID=A0AAD3T0V0_NEPGR|nr:hypothetical protein Nepgr_021913 [Nepenthes gracilis]